MGQQLERPRVEIDPTTLAVLRRSLTNLVNEMGATLAKVAYSPVISEGRDFAGALFDREGHLIACGDHDLTGLLGTLEPTLALIFQTYEPDEIREGDIIACNSTHEAGNHLNDIRMVKPIFADGELIAFAADVGHWTDVGGATPGSINPLAKDAFAEGIRLTPVKFVDAGVFRRDVVDMILANVRLPYESNGDVWAQMRALDAGESRLKQLVGRYGVDTILTTFELMQEHAEAIFRKEIEVMRDGVAEFEDWIDADPLDPEQRPVKVALKLTKQGDRLVFDFSASDPQPKAGVGAPRPLTQSGVYVATLNLFHDIPFNHGFIRNLEIVTTPSSSVHVTFPNPVSGCAAGAFEKVIACVLNCIGQLAPTKRVGSTYNLINATLGGVDPRFDRPYVMYMWNEGGFGGGPDQDGGDAPTMAMYATGSRNQPIEVHERFFPVLYTELEIAQDSAGAGKWRGCPGIRHSYRLTDGDAVVGVFGDRNKFKPWGVEGGLDGGGQNVYVDRGRSGERELGMSATDVPVKAGEVVEVWSSGGGGYGDPLERDPGLVLRDVELGFVSSEAARSTYGVVVTETDPLLGRWQVDDAETTRCRGDLAAARHDEHGR
jgi:N-methylhydantoinase B